MGGGMGGVGAGTGGSGAPSFGLSVNPNQHYEMVRCKGFAGRMM